MINDFHFQRKNGKLNRTYLNLFASFVLYQLQLAKQSPSSRVLNKVQCHGVMEKGLNKLL